MLDLFADMTQRKAARIAGFMYLGLIVFGIISQVTRMSFIEPDDATQTANNIMANPGKFEAANVVWLFSEMFLLLLGLALYVVLKPVNQILAKLMVLFIVVGVAIESLNTLNNFAAVQYLSGAEYLSVFSQEQLNANAMYHLELWDTGYAIAAIMSFGPWLVPAGYLWYQSGYVPKILGILAMLAGIGIFMEGILHFAPDSEGIALPFSLIAVIGEFAVCGWLIIMGVKIPEMKEQDETPAEMTEAESE